MKTFFEEPKWEVITFQREDIVCASKIVNEEPVPGDPTPDMPLNLIPTV